MAQGLEASAAKHSVRWDAVQRAVDAEERRIAALEAAGAEEGGGGGVVATAVAGLR